MLLSANNRLIDGVNVVHHRIRVQVSIEPDCFVLGRLAEEGLTAPVRGHLLAWTCLGVQRSFGLTTAYATVPAGVENARWTFV